MARCRLLDRRKIRALLDAVRDGEQDDSDVLDAVLVSVDGIGDKSGTALPEAAQLAAVRESLALSSAVAIAYFREVGGSPSPAEKNSQRSRAR